MKTLAMACLLIAAVSSTAAEKTAPSPMAFVPAGDFALPFRSSLSSGVNDGDPSVSLTPDRKPLPSNRDSTRNTLRVNGFWLDRYAVTNADFLTFIREQPSFRRSRIHILFADPGYLRAWSGDLQPRPGSLDAPVTSVSWHAAKAYCQMQGKRLPTTAEWERAAASLAPGRDSATQERTILAWYARSTQEETPAIGTGTRHAYGIFDLHGVIWEWTADFNSWNGGGVNKRGVRDEGLFCGGAPANAAPNTSYATYMRWGFRGSLKPDYTVATLGFRCARDEIRKGE